MRCLVGFLVCLFLPSVAAAQERVGIRSDSTVADGDWSLQLALGANQDEMSGLALLRHGLTDRLTWAIPTLAFAYQFGERGGTEIVPAGGITEWGVGYSSIEGWIVTIEVGAGAALRQWLDHDTAINFTASASSPAGWRQHELSIPLEDNLSRWRAVATLGMTRHFGQRLTLNLGVRGSAVAIADGEMADSSEVANPTVAFGSVETIGLRTLPLVEIGINDTVAIDLHGSVGYELEAEETTATAMAGTTLLW